MSEEEVMVTPEKQNDNHTNLSQLLMNTLRKTGSVRKVDTKPKRAADTLLTRAELMHSLGAGMTTDTEFQLTMLGITPDELIQRYGKFREIFAFHGFNVRNMIPDLIKKYTQADKNWSVRIPISKTNNYVYDGNSPFKNDMAILCLIVVNRGTDWEKTKTRSIEGCRQLMEKLEERYNINTQKRKSGELPPDDAVTLSRIASCFPLPCVHYMAEGLGRFVEPPCKVLDMQAETKAMRAICAPMMPSITPQLICEDNSKLKLHPAMLLNAVYFDNVIHPNITQRTKLGDMWKYYIAGFLSSNHSEEERKKAFDSLGLTENGKPTQELTAISNKSEEYIKRLRALRSDDPDLDYVIEELNTL